MAKYDPMLQQSSGNPYIAPGIATPSWANVLPELADIGMKTYGAMKTTDLWEQMQGDITGYLQDKSMADSQATAAQQEYNAGVAHENKLWDAAGTIPEHIGIGQQGQEFDGAHPAAFVDAGEIDAVQRNLTQTFDRFVRAKEAGKMSVNELYTRIQTTVKTAAANNPLIQDELIKQAEKYMEVSGASSWMKAKLSMEEKAAKDEDALFKQDEAWAKLYGVSLSRPNWREEAREQAVLAQNHTLDNNRMEEMMKRRTISKQQLSEIVNDPMQRQKWMKGALGIVHETFMHGSSQGMNPNEVFRMTNSAIDSQITFVNSLMAYLPPDERVSLQGEAKLLEEQRSIYKELAEGGPSAAAAQNKLAYAQALAKMPNVSANEAADMLLKIANIHRTIMGETGELPWGTDVSSQLGNKDQILKYMQQMQGSVDIYTHPVINVDSLASPSGKEAVKITSSLISPNYHPDALRINSQSIDKFLDHVAAIKDPDAATQAADVYVKQMLDSAKAANMPVGKMLDAASLAKLNTHLGSLMGSFRSGMGQVDYDPQLNTFSYLNEDGSVNKVASDRANMIFKAVISANGFTDEATIDKWGSSVSANAMKSMVDPRLTRLQTMADGYNAALQEGDTELANAFKVSMARLEKEMGGYVTTKATPSGAYPSDVTTSPAPSIPVVTNKALLDSTIPKVVGTSGEDIVIENARGNREIISAIDFIKQYGVSPHSLMEKKTQQEVKPAAGISLELAKDLREKKPKVVITPQQESTKKAIENLEAQDKGFKASPMMKRNPATDAVVPTTVTEAMIESLGQVHPAAGMAAAAALVAFGGVKGAPELAKLMPKLLNPAGKVTTGSNVVLAGGNVGANKAIVTSILATAEKTKKAKMESLYKEYWKTGWQKDRVELPKTDVEWSQAIAQANEYVARKMNPEMFKTMKGK